MMPIETAPNGRARVVTAISATVAAAEPYMLQDDGWKRFALYAWRRRSGLREAKAICFARLQKEHAVGALLKEQRKVRQQVPPQQ